jgi:predicted metalloendopeptidase
MTKKYLMKLAAILGCAMTMAVLTACTDNGDNPSPVVDDKEWKADAYVDTSVRPGDDFFLYCNGSYWNNTTVDETNRLKRLFLDELGDEMSKREEALTYPSMEKILADADKTDAATIKAQKAKLQSAIDRVNALTTKEETWKLIAQLMKEGYSSPLELAVFSVGGKMGAMLQGRMGNDHTPNSLMKESMSWQLANNPDLMAKIRPLTGATTRGFDNEKYPMLVTIFQELGISLDDAYLPELNPDVIEAEIVEQNMQATLMMQDSSVEDWKIGLLELLNQDAVYFDDAALQAVNTAEGTSLTHRQAAENFAGKYLDYEKSYVFAKTYISADQKQVMKGFAEELRQTFRERIQNNIWMSDGSKQNAIEKLNAMTFNIGAPDEWFEEGLADLSQEQTTLDDVLALRRANIKLKCKLMGMPNSKASFHNIIILRRPLTTVNAFYVGNYNAMFIYPAFVLTPAYSPEVNDAHNYATMMAWGHEITHGFDTDGARWNKTGDLEDIWASDADRQEFQKRSQQLIDYYSTFDVMPFETGLKNDGAFTVAENVADLGGFFLAYDSYVKHLKSQGFTGDQLRLQKQRFYEAYAYLWCGKWNVTHAKGRTLGDEANGIEKDNHSLFRERVNGVVTNTDDWYDLFDVKPTDKLYLAPEKRIRIW